MSGGSSKSGAHFFKVLMGDFSERLSANNFYVSKRIPPAFVKHNVMDLSQRAELKGPSGCIWHVQLSRRDTDTYLQDGWKKFVEDHSLEKENFLLFRYDGNMLFTVRIFDNSGCEIEEKITCNTSQEFILRSGKTKGGSAKRASSDFEQHSQHKLSGSDTKNRKDYVHSLQTSKRNNTDSTQRQRIPKINRFKKIKTENVGLTMSKTCSYSMGVRHISKKQPSTTEERTKALEKADAFSKASKFPNFLKIMNRSSVGTCAMLKIPVYFMRMHLPKERTNLFLWDPKGRTWEVRFIPRYDQGSLSGGWRAFSHGNDLKQGDICVLELVGECQMQVHIFPSKTQPSAPA